MAMYVIFGIRMSKADLRKIGTLIVNGITKRRKGLNKRRGREEVK